MLKEHAGQKGEMEGRRIYGSSAFVAEISKAYNIEELIGKRGRPRRVIGEK